MIGGDYIRPRRRKAVVDVRASARRSAEVVPTIALPLPSEAVASVGRAAERITGARPLAAHAILASDVDPALMRAALSGIQQSIDIRCGLMAAKPGEDGDLVYIPVEGPKVELIRIRAEAAGMVANIPVAIVPRGRGIDWVGAEHGLVGQLVRCQRVSLADAESGLSMLDIRGAAERETVCIDLDGILRSGGPYRPGQPDAPPVGGAIDAIAALAGRYRVVVLTARPTSDAIEWIRAAAALEYVDDVTRERPEAVAYIDERAVRFDGWERTLTGLDIAASAIPDEVRVCLVDRQGRPRFHNI